MMTDNPPNLFVIGTMKSGAHPAVFISGRPRRQKTTSFPDGRKARAACGFTLIELSIVLVIIGLIVGGVLVGQDLIHAAQLRATISQYHKFQTAVYTFENKYGALPGDLTKDQATALGFQPIDRAPGYGTGAITGDVTTPQSGLFWQDLSSAGLIENSFNSVTADTGWLSLSVPPSKFYPMTKLDGDSGWVVGTYAYFWNNAPCAPNCYYLRHLAKTGGGWSIDTKALTPNDAYNIDAKLDDGIATTGQVRDWNTVAWGVTNSVCDDYTEYPLTVTDKICSVVLGF